MLTYYKLFTKLFVCVVDTQHQYLYCIGIGDKQKKKRAGEVTKKTSKQNFRGAEEQYVTLHHNVSKVLKTNKSTSSLDFYWKSRPTPTTFLCGRASPSPFSIFWKTIFYDLHEMNTTTSIPRRAGSFANKAVTPSKSIPCFASLITFLLTIFLLNWSRWTSYAYR